MDLQNEKELSSYHSSSNLSQVTANKQDIDYNSDITTTLKRRSVSTNTKLLSLLHSIESRENNALNLDYF